MGLGVALVPSQDFSSLGFLEMIVEDVLPGSVLETLDLEASLSFIATYFTYWVACRSVDMSLACCSQDIYTGNLLLTASSVRECYGSRSISYGRTV